MSDIQIKELRKQLRELNAELKDYLLHKAWVDNTAYRDPFVKIFVNQIEEIIVKPKDKLNKKRELEAMIRMLSGKMDARDNTDEQIKKAKQISIVTLHPFKKAKQFGNKFTASCPFHKDDTPSFIINRDNTFHCFSCQKHGDAIQFIMELKNLDFLNAVRFLNDTRIS